MLAMAIYDIPKKPPWGWMVSAYLWTKSLASGTFLVPFILMAMGFQWSLEHLRALSLVALAWLLVTGLLLVADLTHPERFYLILIRPQWRSWLARGALVITGFGALLALFAATTYWTWLGLGNALAGATAMLALFTAVYTGFLFAQARARDLWQSPLLPLHLAVQALVAGSAAVILILAIWPFGEEVLLLVGYFLGGSALVHLILAVSEAFFPHPTSEGTESARAMHTGPFKRVFLLGLALSGGVPLTATYSSQLAIAASFAALIGLALYEHAYVQAGQSVPLR
jgi:formate-dependent nitrite reductase membrane component NrfD